MVLKAAALTAALAAASVGVATPGHASAFPGTNGRIVMVRDDGAGGRSDIVTDGGVSVTSTSTQSEGAPAWDPSHNRIAYVGLQGAGFDIFVQNVDGSGRPSGNPVNITNTQTVRETQPTWSRDGNRIAFVRDDGAGHTDIFTMNAAGGTLRNISRDDRALHSAPTYSPLSNDIVWSKNRNLVTAADSSTGATTNLTNTPDIFEEAPNFRPDGGSLIFTVGTAGSALRSIVAASLSNLQNQTVLVPMNAIQTAPKCSPNGETLLFTRLRPDGSGVDVARTSCRTRTDALILARNRYAADWQRLP